MTKQLKISLANLAFNEKRYAEAMLHYISLVKENPKLSKMVYLNIRYTQSYFKNRKNDKFLFGSIMMELNRRQENNYILEKIANPSTLISEIYFCANENLAKIKKINNINILNFDVLQIKGKSLVDFVSSNPQDQIHIQDLNMNSLLLAICYKVIWDTKITYKLEMIELPIEKILTNTFELESNGLFSYFSTMTIKELNLAFIWTSHPILLLLSDVINLPKVSPQEKKNNLGLNYNFYEPIDEDLANKDKRIDTFKRFGAAILGPFFAIYFNSLTNYLKDQSSLKKIYFLSREGYFLEKCFDILVSPKLTNKIDKIYLNVSRKFLFKITLSDKNLRLISLQQPYRGNAINFLKDRYGFDNNDLNSFTNKYPEYTFLNSRDIKLPDDQELLNNILDLFDDISKSKCEIYLKYLKSLRFGNEKYEHLIDLGYSGTIQKMLTGLTGVQTVGHYFITTDKAIDTPQTKFIGHIIQNVINGSGNFLLERSSFLESILTSPSGSLTDIRINNNEFEFVFGNITKAQKNINLLQAIVDGGIDYAKNAIESNATMDNIELNNYYGNFVSKLSNFPDDLVDMFEMDDSISGINILNPIKYFIESSSNG